MEQVNSFPLVSARSNVFKELHSAPICLPDYSTIGDYFVEIGWPQGSKEFAVVFLNGLRTTDWDYIVQPGDSVQFIIIPGGGGGDGKNGLMIVAMLAITVFSAGVGSGLWFGLQGTQALVAGAVTGVVGNLLVGAIFKPPVASNNTLDGVSEATDPFAPSALITGQSNSARIGGVIPKIFGSHYIYPDLAAIPYIVKTGCMQTLHALYCVGYGQGNVPLSESSFGGISPAAGYLTFSNSPRCFRNAPSASCQVPSKV